MVQTTQPNSMPSWWLPFFALTNRNPNDLPRGQMDSGGSEPPPFIDLQLRMGQPPDLLFQWFLDPAREVFHPTGLTMNH
jgi:hypothetical protein